MGSFQDFDLIKLLGAGGQGYVYLCEDKTGKQFAIKILRRAHLASKNQLRRFKREAQVLQSLHHPNIRGCHSWGEHEGEAFIVMQYIEGENLAQVMSRTSKRQRSRLENSDDQRIHWIELCASAIEAAHNAGIVHRDLKPSNILIRKNGVPSVLDFGLAHIETDHSSSVLTLSGDVLGTPTYMSPEQRFPNLGIIDRATDVYSLACILHELLLGEAPRCADQYGRPLEPIFSLSRKANLPQDLITVLCKALAFLPEDRYQRASDFADDLGRVRQGIPILARKPSFLETSVRWLRRNRVVASVVAIVFLSLSVALATSLWSLRTTSESRRSIQNALLKSEANLALSRARLLANREPGEAVRMALDAAQHANRNVLEQTLLHVIDREFEDRIVARGLGRIVELKVCESDQRMAILNENGDVFVRSLKEVGESERSDMIAKDCSAICWSGKTLFVAEKQGTLIAISPGNYVKEKRYEFHRPIVGLCGLPHSQDILIGAADGRWSRYSAKDSNETWATMNETDVSRFAVSEDGELGIAFGKSTNAYVFATKTGQVLEVLQHSFPGIAGAAFSPDRRSVLVSSRDNRAWIWDLDDGKPSTVLIGHESGVNGAAWHPSRSTVYTTSYDRSIKVWDPKSGEASRTLIGHRDSVVRVRLSQGGRSILSASKDGTVREWPSFPRERNWTYTMSAASAHSIYPSPDGRWLAGASFVDIEILDTLTGKQEQKIKTYQGTAFAWLNDSSFLYCTHGRLVAREVGSTRDSWKFELPNGFQPKHILISPDHSRLVIHSRGDSALLFDILGKQVLAEFDALKPFYSLGNAARASFTHCGRYLASYARSGSSYRLELRNPKTGKVLHRSPARPAIPLSCAVHPKKPIIVMSDAEGSVHIVRLDKPEKVESHVAHTDGINGVAFDKTGNFVATAGRENVAKLFKFEGFELLRTFRGHDSVIYGVSISEDSKILATHSWDKTAILYDLRSGEKIVTQDLHERAISELFFIPNSQAIATLSCLDATIRVWPRSPWQFVKTATGSQLRD